MKENPFPGVNGGSTSIFDCAEGFGLTVNVGAAQKEYNATIRHTPDVGLDMAIDVLLRIEVTPGQQCKLLELARIATEKAGVAGRNGRAA